MRSRSYALALSLALLGGALSVPLSSYGARIVRAPSAAAAAPFAAPFALLTALSAAALTLSVVALCDERTL